MGQHVLDSSLGILIHVLLLWFTSYAFQFWFMLATIKEWLVVAPSFRTITIKLSMVELLKMGTVIDLLNQTMIYVKLTFKIQMYCEIISFRVHTTLYFFFQKWHIQGHCNVWISTHLHDELNLKLFFIYIWMCSSMIKLIKINGNECPQHIILIPQLISLCVKTHFFSIFQILWPLMSCRFLTYWPISSDHGIFSSEPPFISLYHETHVGFITVLNVSAVYGTCIVYVLGIAW